jgi:cobalt-zinc-cadmium efflux system outer membrane protein
MSCSRRARWIAAYLFLFAASPVAAEPIDLDLHGAIARAVERAPDGVAARGRIGEAEARRVDAGLRWRDNPELELAVGPRFASDGGAAAVGSGDRSADLSVRLGQSFTRGHSARLALTDAGVAQARAEVAATERELARDVSLAFYAALHADRVVDATRRAEELATRAADAANRRRAAGAISDLEVDLARAAMGRARSAARAAESERAAALGALAAMIGAAPDDVLVLRGDLHPIAPSERPGRESRGPSTRRDDAARSGQSGERADLRAIAAERAVAAAEERVARATSGWQLGAFVEYAREENAQIVLGGLRVTLPAWNRGQGARAERRAREARIETTLAARSAVAARETRDARDALAHAREAVELFEAEVLPFLDDAEGLLERSIEAGTLPIREYLVVRGELLDGRREYLDRLLALAQADVNARFAAGEMP